jgi:tRNA(fMet)-specific endonuclease VapC
LTDIALDTNAYAGFKQGRREAIEIFRRAERLALPAVVLGEIFAGFAGGTREARNRQELAELLDSPRVLVLAVTDITAEHFGRVFATLKRKGRPIPSNDLWIAACALEHRCALFSYDRHFEDVDGLIAGAAPEVFFG